MTTDSATGVETAPERPLAQQAPGRPRASALHRWTLFVARHRRAVLGIWAIVAVVAAVLYPKLKGELSAPEYEIEGSQSAQVEHLLEQPRFHGAGSEQDAIVFHSSLVPARDPLYRHAVERVLLAARSQAGVQSLASPYAKGAARAQISADGRTAVATVGLAGSSSERFEHSKQLQEAVRRASDSRVHAWLTGFSPLTNDIAQVDGIDAERAEAIGMPVALAVLVLALGALGAALMPLLLAGAGMLLTFVLLYALSTVITFDAFLLTIVTMVGLGIGIDYSLFIVSRFREELKRSPAEVRRERRRIGQALADTVATSGRTILYSGVIVCLSLTSLLVMRSPIFREFAIGTIATVACTLTAALTLLPAVLAQLGERINAGSLPARLQPPAARGDAAVASGGWARWAQAMMRRPLPIAACASAALLLAAAPALHLRSGIDFGLPSLAQTPSGKGAQLLTRSFSPGMMGPVEIVVSGRDRDSPLAAGRMLAGALAHDSRASPAVQLHSYGNSALLTVVPLVPVDSLRAAALVTHLRRDVAPQADRRYKTATLVGGLPAKSVDTSSETTHKLPAVLGMTLALALVFLLLVFRSLILPVKAIAMNLLATGATLGLVVLIFQDGHGHELLGFTSSGFIQSYLPLLMFVLLFGLSMDYEVFLIRRMQESWRRSGDNEAAVVSGITHTARPISAAAAIMVAVFGSFVTADNLELKQFGFALSASIAIDATLIRLVLVPALMRLLGRRNWWLPSALDRVLPRLELD